MTAQAFPLGLARGDSFCNRDDERAELAARLAAGRHSWLSAPRRYGKSSLLHRSLEDIGRRKVSGAVVDLLPTYDRASAEAAVLEGVGLVSGDLMPSHRRALELVRRIFAGLRPELSLEEGSLRVRLQVEGAGPDPLRRALLGLDELARERKVRVVLILDEFQKLRQLSDHEALEANIRHAAERATACTYVFSGSHRHLLEQQFEDPQAPLYRLCEPLDLERIGEADYRAHLEAHARRRWRRKPPAALIERILVLTERHPYYVNYLCGSLWQSRSIPDEAEVVAEWARLVRAQQTQFAAQLEPLSPNQVAFLHALARNPTEQVQSQEFLAQAGLASSSAAKVRRDLARSDLIGSWPDGRLHVLDPGMRHYLLSERALRIPGVE